MSLLIKNLLFTIVVPGSVAVYIPLAISRDATPASAPKVGLGVALLSLGVAVYSWCVWDFATRGRGTPAPIDAPGTLVVRGLYEHTRNPMYLGVLLAVLGWAAFFGSIALLIYALVVGTCFHLFVLAYEEPHLTQKFGNEYDTYRKRVRRWLPRLRGRWAE